MLKPIFICSDPATPFLSVTHVADWSYCSFACCQEHNLQLYIRNNVSIFLRSLYGELTTVKCDWANFWIVMSLCITLFWKCCDSVEVLQGIMYRDEIRNRFCKYKFERKLEYL
jgi:hypothetical protein